MFSCLSLGRSSWYDVCLSHSFPNLRQKRLWFLFPRHIFFASIFKTDGCFFFSFTLFQSLSVSHEHRWRGTNSSGSSETPWAAREWTLDPTPESSGRRNRRWEGSSWEKLNLQDAMYTRSSVRTRRALSMIGSFWYVVVCAWG